MFLFLKEINAILGEKLSEEDEEQILAEFESLEAQVLCVLLSFSLLFFILHDRNPYKIQTPKIDSCGCSRLPFTILSQGDIDMNYLLWSDSNHEFRNEFSLFLILIIKIIRSKTFLWVDSITNLLSTFFSAHR